ncbi:M23 family metallopeptidase [Crassaminicella indica]|uniref:M23 family metallopeptidase n=1 Tax=Crassaminicella indica TaxID=2855394 RepID=A0ABX8RCX5_9CLOT|nr:M23 family metallopeptidase [Crassaminicella indica]QXM05765.1 M23 family metallopeptidase [Crassaminicella indica]
MNKSYLYYQNRKPHKNNENSFYKKFLKQIVLCILIVLLVILMKNIHSPITNKTTEMIKISLTKEMDIKKSIRGVIKYAKEIPKMPEKVVNVFSDFSGKKDLQMEFAVPVKGDIISDYGEKVDPISNIKTFQRGVDILIDKDKNIKAIADGEIIEIGEGKSLGKYVKVKHSHNIISLYADCSDIQVKKGQKVKKGEIIAKIYRHNTNAYLHFELWVDGKVVDPEKYIPFDRKIL